MFKLIISLLFAISLPAQALESPFASEVDGLDIKNSHYVTAEGDKGTLIRGMEPRTFKDARQLYAIGVDHILTFKKSRYKGERLNEDIQETQDVLHAEGFDYRQMSHIGFPWKFENTYSNRVEVCEQIVEAMDILESQLAKGKTVYLHCTVGEDRTGLLAGLFRMKNHNWSAKEAFHLEMCENGYEHGNRRKPFKPVVVPIRESLTPMFWELAYVLSETPERWGKGMCKRLGRDSEYRRNWKPELQFMKCPNSSKFPYQEGR